VLIDTIMPEHEIYLVAGASGAGKTTWLLQMLVEWSQGLPVLGYASHPEPWVYATADRSKDGAERRMTGSGLNPSSVPLIAAWDNGLSFDGIVDRAVEAKAKLLVIDGFSRFSPSHNSSTQVSNWLNSVHRTMRMHDMTLMGVCEEPKMKPKDRYAKGRQRISGPAAWGHHAETVFLIEHFDDKKIGDPRRKLILLPREAPEVEFRATIATGRFTILP
jgi:RecA-family ATPase